MSYPYNTAINYITLRRDYLGQYYPVEFSKNEDPYKIDENLYYIKRYTILNDSRVPVDAQEFFVIEDHSWSGTLAAAVFEKGTDKAIAVISDWCDIALHDAYHNMCYYKFSHYEENGTPVYQQLKIVFREDPRDTSIFGKNCYITTDGERGDFLIDMNGVSGGGEYQIFDADKKLPNGETECICGFASETDPNGYIYCKLPEPELKS